ncbi:glycosyl transferase, partial [Amycolatopsis sp. H20-H5]|uniref:glycosyl transferase n=1 Tax=Amycolatopsis sp. H20-H5 TaxID=3046309 RepID=UPI002DB93C55
MAQQSWGVALPGRSPATPLSRHEARAAATHRLLSLDVMLALLALTGGLRLLRLMNRSPTLNSEAATVAHTYAVGHFTSFTDTGGVAASPFGWLQLAGYTLVSRAFDRETTAMSAVREAMVVAAVLSAVLLWLLARRLALPRWAATVAVLLTAVSPFAIGLQHVVVVEQVAAVWVLAGLVLIRTPAARARPWHDVIAALCLLAAILTSPLALAFLPAAGWLLWRDRAPARAGLAAVVLTLGLGLAFGPGGQVLRPGLSWANADGPLGWLALDPALLVLSAVALVAGLFVTTLRPLAVSGLLLAAALCWPGAPSAGLFVLLLPVPPLLVAGIAHTVATRLPRPGQHSAGMRRPVLITALCLVLTAAIGVSWVQGFDRLGLSGRTGEPLLQARNWLRDNASGSTLLVDDAAWAELAAGGWPTGALVSPTACRTACPAADWSVSTGAMTGARHRFAALDGELSEVTDIAVFGEGADRVTVARLDVQPTPPENATWAHAGTALASSAALTSDGGTAELLRQGKVDPRLLGTIAALLALHPVRIAAFPAVDGEDAAGQPRRRVLISGDDNGTAEFFGGQRDVFRPDAVSRTS